MLGEMGFLVVQPENQMEYVKKYRDFRGAWKGLVIS
jgi:hypothetical protein